MTNTLTKGIKLLDIDQVMAYFRGSLSHLHLNPPYPFAAFPAISYSSERHLLERLIES